MTFLYICSDSFVERERSSCSVTLIRSHMGDLRHGASASFHNTSSLVFFEMLEIKADSPKPRRKPTKSSVTTPGLVVSRNSLCIAPAFTIVGCIPGTAPCDIEVRVWVMIWSMPGCDSVFNATAGPGKQRVSLPLDAMIALFEAESSKVSKTSLLCCLVTKMPAFC